MKRKERRRRRGGEKRRGEKDEEISECFLLHPPPPSPDTHTQTITQLTLSISLVQHPPQTSHLRGELHDTRVEDGRAVPVTGRGRRRRT